MTIHRYTVGMGRGDLDDAEDEPCLFQDDNGEAVTYDDHIAEVQRLRELLSKLYNEVEDAEKYAGSFLRDVIRDEIKAEICQPNLKNQGADK